MVCRFKAQIPTRRRRRICARGGFHAYDNIGNRKTAQENAEEVTNYDANALNQYTAVGDFVPEFDADGNQTKVLTCTGIWNVTYNAENRPVTFARTNADGTTTRVTCAYDYMGRRTTKKVETVSVSDTETGESTATTILHQRYIYRGYLQIAGFDLTESGHSFSWSITWDPTQPVATRPLAIRKDGTWYCYGWDLTKNVCEVFSNEGYISNTVIYSYTPYGAVTAEGSVQQPIQWSSEYYDDELGLVYYNYRHYNSYSGHWLGRDPLHERSSKNMYVYFCPILSTDYLGLVYDVYYIRELSLTGHAWIQIDNTDKTKEYNISGAELKKIDPNLKSLKIYIPEALGFYPSPETADRPWWKDILMILNFSFDGKIKYGEDKKYSQIIRSEERDGEKTIVLNINQFDTTLKKSGYLNHDGEGTPPKGATCCSKLDSNSNSDKQKVLSCIRKYSNTGRYHLYTNNCRQVARKILSTCCLEKNDNVMTDSNNNPATTIRVKWEYSK